MNGFKNRKIRQNRPTGTNPTQTIDRVTHIEPVPHWATGPIAWPGQE